MRPMKTIIKNIEKTYIKEKSKFIAFIYQVSSEDEIEKILNAIKRKYYDATHICYAYILPNKQKCFDDGEPKGTAGIPILEVMNKNNLSYCLGIVVRYFGGIKLGAGGLVRAYTKALSDTLLNNIKEMETGYIIQINENYDKKKELDYLLKTSQIINCQFTETIQITVLVNKKTLDTLSNVNYTIIQEKYF